MKRGAVNGTGMACDYRYNVVLLTSHRLMALPGEVCMASVEERVKTIVVDLLGVDESRVSPDAHFRDDLEADSLDLVELIMAFEEEFGGEISDEDAQKIETVGQAVDYIQAHME